MNVMIVLVQHELIDKMLMDAMGEKVIELINRNMVEQMMFDNQMCLLMVKDYLVEADDPYVYIEPSQSIPYSPFLVHRLID
jgi:hypothetical protein